LDKALWLKIAAGLSFFMAICQTVITLSPAAAAYFQAPPPLLENRRQLLLIQDVNKKPYIFLSIFYPEFSLHQISLGKTRLN
jgi:hypothetical protein